MTIHFDELIQNNATSLLRGRKFSVKEVQFPDNKHDAAVVIKEIAENDIIRRLELDKRIVIEESKEQVLGNIIQIVDNFWRDIIVINFMDTTKLLIEETRYLFITNENRVLRICENGQVKDDKGEIVAQELKELDIIGDLYIPQFNSNSGVNAERYLGFRIEYSGDEDGEIKYNWAKDLYKILGLEPPKKLDFKSFIGFVGRQFQSATPSMTFGDFVKRFMFYLGEFGQCINSITQEGGNFLDGGAYLTIERALKIVKDALPDMEFTIEDDVIYAVDEEGNKEKVDIKLALQARPLAVKGYFILVGGKFVTWIRKHYKVLTLSRYDEKTQYILDYWFEHKCLPKEYKDVEVLDIYTDDENEPVEYIVDDSTVKCNFDVKSVNFFNILKMAHAGAKEVKCSKQMTDKFIRRSDKITNIIDRAIIRETRDILEETLNPTKKESISSNYINEINRNLAPEDFKKSKLFYRKSEQNVMKRITKLTQKMNPKMSGMSRTLVVDPSKLIAKVEGKAPIIKHGEIYIPGIQGGLRFVFIKYPTNGKYEYLVVTTISRKEYMRRLKNSKISDLGKEAIAQIMEHFPEGLCVMNVTPEEMSQIATFDVDGDMACLYGLKASWKHAIKRALPTGSVTDNILKIHGQETQTGIKEYAYAVVGSMLHRFEILYDNDIQEDECFISSELIKAPQDITIVYVPLKRDIIEIEDENGKITSYDVTELEGEFLLEVDRIRNSEKRSYFYNKAIKRVASRVKTNKKQYDLTPEGVWDASKVTVHFGKTHVSDYANANNINAQVARELWISTQKPELKNFPGVSPTLKAIVEQIEAFKGSTAQFVGLVHQKGNQEALKALGYDDIVEINSSIIGECLKEMLTASASIEGFFRLTEVLEMTNYIGTDDVIGSKKSGVAHQANPIWEKMFNGLQLGSQLGALFEITKDNDFDKVNFTLGIDIKNKKIEEYNRTHAFKRPYVIRDEGTYRLESLATKLQNLIYQYIPDNNEFENIADKEVMKFKNRPVAAFIYTKMMYYAITGMFYDQLDAIQTTEEEMRLDLEATIKGNYKKLRIAIGNTLYACLSKVLTDYEIGMLLLYFSNKGVGVNTLGVEGNETCYYSIKENVVTRSLLQKLLGSPEYTWLEKLTPFVDDVVLEGDVAIVERGIVASSFYVEEAPDGEYPLVIQQGDEEDDAVHYYIERRLEYQEDEELNNVFCVYSEGALDFEKLETIKNEKIDIVAHYDDTSFDAAIFNCKNELVIRLAVPSTFADMKDRKLFADFLNSLRDCEISTLYNTENKCLITLTPGTNKLDEETIADCIAALQKSYRVKSKNNNEEKEDGKKSSDSAKNGNPFKNKNKKNNNNNNAETETEVNSENDYNEAARESNLYVNEILFDLNDL